MPCVRFVHRRRAGTKIVVGFPHKRNGRSIPWIYGATAYVSGAVLLPAGRWGRPAAARTRAAFGTVSTSEGRRADNDVIDVD